MILDGGMKPMAGLVLCGGRSSRMGEDKAALRLGGQTLLERALEQLAPLTPLRGAVWGQGAPPGTGLPRPVPGLVWAADARPQGGPLEGLRAGWGALAQSVAERGLPEPWGLLVTAVDMPFLTTPWLAALAQGLDHHPAVCWSQGGVANPLAAAYRWGLRLRLEELALAGERAPRKMLEAAGAAVWPVEQAETLGRVKDLLAHDPQGSPNPLDDLDTPEDVRRAQPWLAKPE
ncbi:MAG: molybdenum cofactor guanylyltransferase [Deltaproteobacteria bacterium]|nr:molybdenum cofactor guanylyltransferase [Deltaproteobacteria bacterium]